MNVPTKAELNERIRKLESENERLRKGINAPANILFLLNLSETCTAACKMLIQLPECNDIPIGDCVNENLVS